MDLPRHDHIDRNPEDYVADEQQRDVDERGQAIIGGGQQSAAAEYRHHGASLAHAQGQQLVMYMRLVRQEGITVGAYAVNVDAYDVEARNQQGRHADNGAVAAMSRHVDAADADAHHAQEKAHGKGAGITHEYLTVLHGVAEHVEVEEGEQRAQCGCGQGRVGVQAAPETYDGIERACHSAKTGGQAVDAVYQVHGIDDEDYEQGGDAQRHPVRHLVDSAEAVQVLYAYAARYDQDRGQCLHHELGAVADADKVVGHAGKVQEDSRAAGETQRNNAAVQKPADGLTAVHDAQPEQKQEGEQYGGEKGNAAQTGNLGLMYLARVRLVE